MKKTLMNNKNYIGSVFWISIVITVIFVLWGAFAPDGLAKSSSILFDFTSNNFGWFYLISTAFFIVFCLYLAFSKYGKIKLGKDEDKPEYSFFTWIGMLFSAGFGVGLVFWGVAEPMSHFMSPPGGAVSQSPEAARIAINYSMFHWGIHQWAIFTVVGLAVGYFQFRKQAKGLISSAFDPLLKNKNSILKPTIDVLAVIATITGVATSLGMGILQINGGLSYIFNTPNTVLTQILIILVLLVLYLISTTTGLDRGIKILSNINLTMALGIMLIVLILGPTIFILNGLTTGIGDYIQNSVTMTFPLNPYTNDVWAMNWTVFYWAWVISWSPFVGTFIARVSRGRTIRQFVFGVLIIPGSVAVLWMGVFGGTAIHMELFQGIAISEYVQTDVTTALFVMFENLPFGYILSIIAILLIITFLITSADSATFVLGMMTTNGNLDPSFSVKLIWGVLLASIAGVLIISSGLRGLQTASLVTALPFTIISIGMCYSLFISLREEEIESEELKKAS